MLQFITQYFRFKRLRGEIQNSKLDDLQHYALCIAAYDTGAFLTDDQVERLYDIWLRKVLLLVTNIKDVEKILDNIDSHWMFRRLCREYASRSTTSVDSIIILLNKLWARHAEFSTSFYQTRLTEIYLVEKALELIPTLSYGLGHIECLAASIVDEVGNGIGACGSEQIVTALVLPKLRYDLPGAIKFARHFKMNSSKYHFYYTFICVNDLVNSHQVGFLVEEILDEYDGGKELAEKILEIVEEKALQINPYIRHQLEFLVREQEAKEQPRVDIDFETFHNFIQAVINSGILNEETVLGILLEMEHDIMEAIMAQNGDDAGSAQKCFGCMFLNICDLPEAEVARLIKKRELAEGKIFQAVAA